MGRGSVLLSIGVVGGLIWVAFVLYFWLPDRNIAGDLVKIIQGTVTSVAIVTGGIFAIVKLELYRDFSPHLTIDHTISHRRIGAEYIHIAVTTTLRNSSKVKVDILEGFFRLQQISPIADEEVELLEAAVFIDREEQYIQWPTLRLLSREWARGELIIEPGESYRETCEFVVPREIESVLIHTYFYNPKRPYGPEGWGIRSVYDLIPSD